METEERDWVDVANDLLCKCHVDLRVHQLTECDAGVFVAMYEAILGEKVPDHVVAKSQEDDIHNIQSVIDSLALDYLQISLSHITGENVVRGDKDSIRNLLEIFDGLLEYLTEQLSEEEEEEEQLRNGELNGTVHPSDADRDEETSQTSSLHSVPQSSKYSWNGEESESTAELIRLGDSARTFSGKQEVRPHLLPSPVTSDENSFASKAPAARTAVPDQPPNLAIPLKPPKQITYHRTERPSSSLPPAGRNADSTSKQVHIKAQTQNFTQSIVFFPQRIPLPPRTQNGHPPKCNGAQTNGVSHTSSDSEHSVRGLREPQLKELKGQVEGGAEGARRVLFRTQPDVLLLSLPSEPSPRDDAYRCDAVEAKQSDEDRLHSSGSSSGRRRSNRSRRGVDGWTEESEDPLYSRSQRNRHAEQELQEMSEKLACRLEELDLMLKRALGETGEDTKPPEEDKRSHHSDSVMECRRVPRPTDKAGADRPARTRSLSPSPPPVPRFHPGMPVTQDQRRKSQMVAEAYKAELRNLDERQRVELTIERLRAQEAEQKYTAAIRKEASRVSKLSQPCKSKLKPSNRSSHSRTAALNRPRIQTRKTAPLRVKDNDLLPALLEDFPPLQFSSHGLSRMWKQQLRQVDQLGSQNNQRKHAQFSTQVEEAHRRHDLLMEIIRKEQEHNQRLKDFRERIQQQRSAQNKLRDQRQQVVRARKYHNDYHVQLRARLLRERSREERMFRQVFEEGLELQKAQLREQRAYAKEQRQEHNRKHRDEIVAMENFYRDQFSMLAERLALEREEIHVRKKAQEKALQKMKRELRNRMEREISELQKIIVQDDEEDYYRHLEVERLRRRVQTASFQHGASCTH